MDFDELLQVIELIADPTGTIKKAEKFFTAYILENKQKIVAQLLATGEYKIVSPYGLTATVTAKSPEKTGE